MDKNYLFIKDIVLRAVKLDRKPGFEQLGNLFLQKIVLQKYNHPYLMVTCHKKGTTPCIYARRIVPYLF